MPSPSEFVLTFLESVGRRQEAEYYLKLFQQLPKASFAVIAADPQLLDNASAMVIEPLRFLSRLGLHPVLATGLFDAQNSPTDRLLVDQLQRAGIRANRSRVRDPEWLAATRGQLEAGEVAVVEFEPLDPSRRHDELGRLLTELNTRKLAITRSRGGLGRKETGVLSLTQTHHLLTNENGISVVNLTSDLDALRAGPYLEREDRELLERVAELHRTHPALVTSVTSPLNLLRELFTVRGAGTLIKTGSAIVTFQGYDGVDQQRLEALLQETFGRLLHPDFRGRSALSVYLEQDYRGVAIVTAGVHGSFLSKFAVNRRAQGEGIGRDLWEAMLRDHPAVYWRARTRNPASDWYQSECDGMHRVGDWRVYWRGVDAQHVPTMVQDAMSRPFDFLEPEK